MYKYVRTLGFLALAMICSSCGSGDYVIKLPNGYRLGRINAIDISISPPGRHSGHPTHPLKGRTVPPRIDKLDVIGNYVLGHVVYDPQVYLSSKKYSGYFVLDTTSGVLEYGLAKSEMYTIARTAIGIKEKDISLMSPDEFAN